ncbi:MAG: NYN domain-containing protein [Chloroflexota bacterium]|nr:NYN domain-containing protein [Chloroflexota bacterium]
MPRTERSPLEGVNRLLVDGNNLLHAGRQGAAPLPATALIGRLRSAIPAEVGIEIVFDGAPEPGLHGERIASGLIVRHGGRWTADQVLISLVEQARATAGGGRGADNVLVVTDDRELRVALQARGARTARSAWLLGRLARGTLLAPAIGNRRPPRDPRAAETPAETEAAEDARRPWKPGRGATTKHGNPKRGNPRRGRPD